MDQERATRGSAYDAGADRIYLRVDEQKGCRPDGVSIELFKITLKGDPVPCRRLLDLVVCIWKREGGVCVAQKWKCAIIMVFYKKRDREECANYKGISLEAHARVFQRLGRAGIRRFSPRGGQENIPFRGWDYMIPYMVGKLGPKSTHFTRGLVKYIPGRGYFRAVPSKNGKKL